MVPDTERLAGVVVVPLADSFAAWRVMDMHDANALTVPYHVTRETMQKRRIFWVFSSHGF